MRRARREEEYLVGPLTYRVTLEVLGRSWVEEWMAPPQLIAAVAARLDRIKANLGLPYMEGL